MIGKISILAAGGLLLASCGGAGEGGNASAVEGAARDQIRAVGSSTVYPFATAVAEQFVKDNAGSRSPIIESTGTGAGVKLFCAGVGAGFPDIVNASRRFKASEFEGCVKNGVSEIAEVQIGIDGIAFAESIKGPQFKLTPKQIYAALAASPFGKTQTAKLWSDVDPALPKIPILVLGPPGTSGTRDAMAELILTKGCDSDPAMGALKKADEDKHKDVCTRLRDDGAYVDAGENDNLIVQKLAANPNAIGVFGYSYLEENQSSVRGIAINDVAPTYGAIADGSYPGARPLYLYIKKAHLTLVPGLKQFVGAFADAWGPDGYLVKRGMVVAPADVRETNATRAATLPTLSGAELK
jgi:phosphate transport system substrate-binding protein